MFQRRAGVADAGLDALPQSGRRTPRRDSGDEHAPSCPLAIIFRGIVVLSIVVGGLGYALANFAPMSPLASFQPSVPTFAPPPVTLASRTPPSTAAETAVKLPADAPLIPVVANRASAARPPQNPQVRRTFLAMLQSALATRQAVLQFGPMRVKRDIVQTIIQAAQDTDTDPVLLMAIADKESSFSPGVEARTSSAMGLFQFVDTTWFKAVREFGPKHGLAKEASMISGGDDRPVVVDPAERAHILDLRKNPYLSAVLAAEMLKLNGEKIAARIGRGLTGGETYLAHFLGRDDAEKFMEKVVGQPQYTAAALLPRPARANASLFYAREGRRSKGLSVAAVHDKFEEMMGLRLDRYKSIAAAAGLSAFTDEKEK